MKTLFYQVVLTVFLFSFTGCNSSSKELEESTLVENMDSRTKTRFKQYMVQGQLLYSEHCANCHQPDGSGLGQLIPPLAGSSYMADTAQTLCVIKYGLAGSIEVNGTEYNQQMPANPKLKDIEIAEIATYIYNSWGNKGGYISVQEASKMLNACEQAQ